MRQNKKRTVWIVVAVVIAIIVLMFVTNGRDAASVPGGVVGSVLTPLDTATSRVARFFSNLFGKKAEEVSPVDARIEELQRQLDEKDKRIAELEVIANFIEDNDYRGRVVTARVSGKAPGFWFDTFLINRGLRDGIAVDMPVITPEGLVGRVVEVNYNYSKVQAIIDSGSAVSGMVDRTRDNGVVRGDPALNAEGGGLCRMHHLLLETDLLPGDKVITSGLDRIFPKNILIGEVTEVARGQSSVERTATISPAVDFAHLEIVMVITGQEAPAQ